MNSLTEYLIEALSPEAKKGIKEIQRALSGSYEGAIETLNEMLKDPRAKEIIEKTFGGEWSNLDLKVRKINLPVQKLTPTQNEIDFGKSIDFGLSIKPEAIPNYFKSPVIIKMPLVTYNSNFVIDGHHRWSQEYAFNPAATMECINFSGSLSASAFLKVVQGSIAASLVEKGVEPAELPVSVVKPGMNILKMSDKDLEKNISEKMTEKAVIQLTKENTDLKDRKDCIKYLVTNCALLRDNNQPPANAPGRPYMPQTDKVEPRPVDDLSPELIERIINTIKLK